MSAAGKLTYEEAYDKKLPFYMWETIQRFNSGGETIGCDVRAIRVVRVGVDHSVGASLPSISFVDHFGLLCRGDIQWYHDTKEDAEAEAQEIMKEIQ